MPKPHGSHCHIDLNSSLTVLCLIFWQERITQRVCIKALTSRSSGEGSQGTVRNRQEKEGFRDSADVERTFGSSLRSTTPSRHLIVACYHKSVWLHPGIGSARFEAVLAPHSPPSRDALSHACGPW